ncbi:MAG: helix-turn-helix transcriptional regulator [Clostridia bacterium]|nr:helix-turn-helix transcriptional regulator [Clostridia bacterium]
MRFQEIIKDILIVNKLSQDQLAKIIGVNQTTISNLLKFNKKNSFDNIYSFYLKFNISPNEFFGLE